MGFLKAYEVHDPCRVRGRFNGGPTMEASRLAPLFPVHLSNVSIPNRHCRVLRSKCQAPLPPSRGTWQLEVSLLTHGMAMWPRWSDKSEPKKNGDGIMWRFDLLSLYLTKARTDT
jgi:hypothetical protein